MSDNEQASQDHIQQPVGSEEEKEEQEVDDLFGDDDEEESQQQENDDEDEGNTRSRSTLPRSDDEDDEGSHDDGDEEEDINEEDLKTIEISLPRHAIPSKMEEDTYSIKVPVFLNVDAHPFDPNEFKEKVQQNALSRNQSSMNAKQIRNDLIAEKLLNENSIRWRYSNSGNDEIIKQSNAHFVEWDDGSVSLKIGSELFDFKSLPLFDNFLVKTHDTYEILQNDSTLNRTANLLPSSTFTSTHRKLTEALKHTQKKETILNTITEKDPLLKQKLADENERKTLKLKRQIEQRRRLQEERLGGSKVASPGVGASGRNGYEPAYERFERTYANEEYDDDEDDFVAGDDEEVEEDGSPDQFDDEDDDDDQEEDEFEKGAERLRKLKDDGDARYSKRSATPSDTQNEDEAVTQRKRRRIIDSDEDDE